jgi:hypothetical protein
MRGLIDPREMDGSTNNVPGTGVGIDVDVVSFHRYPFPKARNSGPPTIDELRQNAQEWDEIIIHARDLIHQYTGRDLPIAIT